MKKGTGRVHIVLFLTRNAMWDQWWPIRSNKNWLKKLDIIKNCIWYANYIHFHKIELHFSFILGLETLSNDSMMPSQLTHLKSNHPDCKDKTLQLAQLFCSTLILNIVFSIFTECHVHFCCSIFAAQSLTIRQFCYKR